MVTVIGVLLIIMGIFLVISVLMQSSKNHRVSGTIAGGAETFFGKQKGKTLDAVFNKITTVVTILFVILVLALCFILPTADEATIEEQLKYYYGEDALKTFSVDEFVINKKTGAIEPKDPVAFAAKESAYLGIDEEVIPEATDEAVTDETVTDEVVTDEAATDEAATDETVTDDIATDETVTDETVTDDIATDDNAEGNEAVATTEDVIAEEVTEEE